MTISTAAFERSAYRSLVRRRVLLMLASLGEAFPGQLARACGIDARRLRAVMFGAPPSYSVAFALCTLELAVARQTPQGQVYAITERGRKKARQLTARAARREDVRRMRREAREAREGPVTRHLAKPAVAGDATPAAAPFVTCGVTWRLAPAP